MSEPGGLPTPGWYVDPTGETRWWDGAGWTATVRPAEPVAAAPVRPPAASASLGAQPVQPMMAATAMTGWSTTVSSTANDQAKLAVPAGWVIAGAPGVGVCAPHGLALTRRQRIVLETPGKAGFHLLLGLIVAMLLTKRRVQIPSWGICSRCVRERRNRLLVPVACLLGCVLSFVAAAALAPHLLSQEANPTTFDPTAMSGSDVPSTILSLLALVLFLAAIVLPMSRLRPGWAAVTRMSIDQTQGTVTFKRPAPAFTAAYRRTQSLSPR